MNSVALGTKWALIISSYRANDDLKVERTSAVPKVNLSRPGSWGWGNFYSEKATNHVIKDISLYWLHPGKLLYALLLFHRWGIQSLSWFGTFPEAHWLVISRWAIAVSYQLKSLESLLCTPAVPTYSSSGSILASSWSLSRVLLIYPLLLFSCSANSLNLPSWASFS